MNAETRCAKAIADGKYATVKEWCRALLRSDHSGIPTEWRFWALSKLSIRTPENDSHGWAKRLKAREESGERLLLCQSNAWRTCLGIQAASVAEAEVVETMGGPSLEC